MKRLLLILPLLFSSLSLSACNPPNCSVNHEGWVKATITNGYDAGYFVLVHGAWTTTGPAPSCVGSFTGLPRRAESQPWESGNVARYSDGTFMKQVATNRFSDSTIHAYILNWRGSQVMEHECITDFGPAILKCESSHVYS